MLSSPSPKVQLMPSSKENSRIVYRESLSALRSHLEPCTVAIVNWSTDPEAPPKDLGSGTCIQIASRYFIATAAHVIKGLELEQIFLVPGTLAPRPKDWMPLLGRGGRGGELEHPIDVAWLEVAPAALPILQKKFLPLDRLAPGIYHDQDDLVLFVGFPVARVPQAQLKDRGLRVQPVSYLTETWSPEKWPTELKANPDTGTDVFIDYNEHADVDGHHFKMVHPEGMSGGGIWLTKLLPPKGVWAPQRAQLIGIEHASDEGLSFARGTQMQHWLRMVREDLPELSSAIDGHFPTL